MKAANDFDLPSIRECERNYLKNVASSGHQLNIDNLSNARRMTEDILLLLRLSKNNPDAITIINNLVECLSKNEPNLAHNYCFFYGRLRIVFVLLKLHDSLKDRNYLSIAEKFVNKDRFLSYIHSPYLHNGLVNGRAGVFLGINICAPRLPSDTFGEVKTSIISYLVQGIIPLNNGLVCINKTSHLGPLADMSEGSAGVLWVLSEYLANRPIDSNLRKTLTGLFYTTNNLWDKGTSSWLSNRKNIETITDHKLFVRKYYAKEKSFFFDLRSNLTFWNGDSGIIVSFISFLKHLRASGAIKNIIKGRIKLAEKRLWSHFSSKGVKKNLLEGVYIYLVLYKYFNENKYLEKAHHLVRTCRDYKMKLSMVLSLQNFDLDALDLIPSFNTNCTDIEATSPNFAFIFINQAYPKTSLLLRAFAPFYFKDFDFSKYRLSEGLYSAFERSIKLESRGEGKGEFNAVRDCLRLEAFKRKFSSKFPNKVFLKTAEIVHRERADYLLGLPNNILERVVMKIPGTVVLYKSAWDWVTIDSDKTIANLKSAPGIYPIAIQARSTPKSIREFLITESQLIFLKKFHRPVSIKSAITEFFSEFKIESKEDRDKIGQFVIGALEYFIFNLLIVESNILEVE